MKKIKAVEMVRAIRDKQALETEGKSTDDIIAYFRKKAGKLSARTDNKLPHQTEKH